MMAQPSLRREGSALVHADQSENGTQRGRSSLLSLADPDRIAAAEQRSLMRPQQGRRDSNLKASNSADGDSSADSASDCSTEADSDASQQSSGTGLHYAQDLLRHTDQAPSERGDTDSNGACGMPGCTFRHRPLELPAAASQARRKAAVERDMTKWRLHFEQRHRGQHEQFLQVHTDRAWCGRMAFCVSCQRMQGKHNLAAHNNSATHQKYVAALARASTATAASQQPDDAPDQAVDPDVPLDGPECYQWDLQNGCTLRRALDELSADRILQYQLSTFRRSSKSWVQPFSVAWLYVLQHLRSAVALSQAAVAEHGTDSEQAAAATGVAEAWAKLLQLTPCLLLAPDGSDGRMSRFTLFAQGQWAPMLQRTLAYTDKAASRPRRARTMADVRRTAARRSRLPGGIGKVSAAYQDGDESSSPRTSATLEALRIKHPAGPVPAELQATAEQASAAAQERLVAQPDITVSACEVFTAAKLKAALRKSNPGSSPGLSGFGVCHLQQMIKYADQDLTAELLKDLVWLGNTVFDTPDALPAAFWTFFRAARLSAVGAKCRPIACGATLRRLFCKVYAQSKRAEFASLFEPVGQYGVAVPAGVERMGLIAQIIYEAGGVLIAVDGRNAFNAVSRTEVLRQAAEHIPEAYALVAKLYASAEAPSLMYGLDGQPVAARLLSAQGVQQGDPLGPVLFALVILPIMREFRQLFPDLTLPGFLDDLTVASLAGDLVTDLRAARAGYDWLVLRLAAVGIAVNTDKTVCLLPQHAAEQLPADRAVHESLEQFASRELGGVKVLTDPGMRLVGAPVGSAEFSSQAVADTLRSTAADRLLHETAMQRDPQTALALLRLCYHSRATFLCRNSRPSVSGPELRRFDGAVMLALAAIMQEPAACTASGLQGDGSPDQFLQCLSSVREHNLPEERLPVTLTQIQKALVRLPHHAGGFGLPSMFKRRHAAFVARTAGALQPAMTALADSQRQRVMGTLFALPTMIELRTSLQELHGCGLSADRLDELVGSPLRVWATTQTADAANGVREWLLSDTEAAQPQRVQSVISGAVDKRAGEQYEALLRAIPEQSDRLRALARHLSMRGRGASAFLATLPSSNRHLSMSPEVYRESLRRWLDIQLPPPGGLCSGTACLATQTATHAARCAKTGEQNYRHNPLCDMIADVLRSRLKLKHVVREDPQYCVAAGFPECRLDVTWRHGQMRLPQWDRSGRLLPKQDAEKQMNGGLIDVTIVDQTGVDLNAASHTAGVAVMRKAEEKLNKYEGKFPPNYTLIPLALEQTGRSCPHTSRFVRAAAEHESSACEGAYTVSACISRWRQRISVVLQRSISESVLRSFRKTRVDPAVGTAPATQLHRLVSLLVLPSATPAETDVIDTG